MARNVECMLRHVVALSLLGETAVTSAFRSGWQEGRQPYWRTFILARYRKAPNAISALTPAGMSLVLPAAIFLNRDSSLEWVRELPVVRAAITTRPMVKAAMSGLEM